MNRKNSIIPFKKSYLSILSLVTIFFGVVFWLIYFTVPSQNIGLDEGFPIWAYTLIVNPVGIILAGLGLKYNNKFSLFGILGNLFMTFSIFFAWYIGYLVEWLTS
ncbi:hypothetical protein [Bacillus canaveralius]|uniref:hypothetical protein n=1 Tax=Bacillus canaveralius TaxID=1403243 RepID=UPI000F7ACC64|nr:hypothetical protein [Bacillus canaveralius]RSK53657.1 hypothetical protein EJA13_07795 [Bacillus canaveralius]